MFSKSCIFLFSAASILGFTLSIPLGLPLGASDLTDNVPDLKIKEYLHFKERLNLPTPSAEELSLILSSNSQLTGESEKFVVDPRRVGFYVYTKKNPSKAFRVYVNNTESLQKSGYQTRYKTKLIVHGFLNHLTSAMIQEIKNNFLSIDYEDVNVIAFDWSLFTIFYVKVYEKSLSAGSIIAEFIDFLVREGTALDDIHCIGHSLGAHACGFAGRKVQNGVIARISGLDPAQPGFNVKNKNKRLNISDAKFVDCIHTCGGTLGITEPICTADYYPNSGVNQPGCPWFDFGGCSHGRSHQFFAESILPGHLFPSVTCDTLYFKPSECVRKGALMGYPASEKYSGILYTKTKSNSPFAYNWTGVDMN